MKSVTYWYQFFTAREELVPILHDVKFTKCEIYGSTEPSQASKGIRGVDFEAILKQINALNAQEGANADTETVGAAEATVNIYKVVLDNDDIEVVRCGGTDLSAHTQKPIINKI